jgi:hypothetical protein
MMAALSGFDLAVSPFLNLAMSRLSIAGFPFQSLSLSCSPETRDGEKKVLIRNSSMMFPSVALHQKGRRKVPIRK